MNIQTIEGLGYKILITVGADYMHGLFTQRARARAGRFSGACCGQRNF